MHEGVFTARESAELGRVGRWESGSSDSATLQDLVLRSRAKHGVSKDGHKPQCVRPSFETRPADAPQDEV
jgi:hypothetical protein